MLPPARPCWGTSRHRRTRTSPGSRAPTRTPTPQGDPHPGQAGAERDGGTVAVDLTATAGRAAPDGRSPARRGRPAVTAQRVRPGPTTSPRPGPAPPRRATCRRATGSAPTGRRGDGARHRRQRDAGGRRRHRGDRRRHLHGRPTVWPPGRCGSARSSTPRPGPTRAGPRRRSPARTTAAPDSAAPFTTLTTANPGRDLRHPRRADVHRHRERRRPAGSPTPPTLGSRRRTASSPSRSATRAPRQ